MLRIYLLGTPQAFDGDDPISLPTPSRVLALWAYLLLKRRQPIPRDHLAFLLWPDVPEAEARANLRRHLYLLRQQLPAPSAAAPWIVTTRHTVQWNLEALCWLDVAFLEAFDAETADEAKWAVLLEVYRGDLLAGSYDDWVLAERAALQQRYLSLLEERVARQRVAGDLQGAIRITRRLLAHDPLREEPYRHLMELYYRVGDRAAALREFERCETLLRAELDTGPMPETLALRDAILRGEVLSPLPGSSPASVAVHDSSAPDSASAAVPSHAPAPAPSRRPVVKRGLVWGLGAGALLVVALLAALLTAGVLPPSPGRELVTISLSGPAVAEDTWLNGLTPDLPYDPEYDEGSYAAYPQVHLQYFNYPYDRILIRFDLGLLPAGAAPEQATFHLHFESFTNEDLPEPLPATVSAFRILRPWEAETATFDAPWSQPGMAPGLDFEAQALGSQAIHGTDWVSIDVSGAVRHWLDHPDENWGLVVMITEAPQGAHYWVDTSDYPLSNRQPRLDVTHVP